jgi:hypothetical protein
MDAAALPAAQLLPIARKGSHFIEEYQWVKIACLPLSRAG